jgi:hypothetical protein
LAITVFYDKNGDGLLDCSSPTFEECFGGGSNPAFSSSIATVTLNGTQRTISQYGESGAITVPSGTQTVRITTNSPWFRTKYSYVSGGLHGPYGYSSSNYDTASYILPPGGSITFRLGINTCTSTCSPTGAKQCASGTSYQTCGDYNGDGCTEWSSATNCQYGCSGGYCNNPPKPTVSISAGPASITSGQSSTLSWSSSNATSVSVSPSIGTVGTSGSLVVKPTSSVSYTAVATGPGGTSNPAYASITVNNQPPPPPPLPGGGTSGGGTSGGKKTSGGSSGTGSGLLETLQLEISVPYLAGKLKVKLDVGGVTKEVEVLKDSKSYTLDFKGSNLSLNKEYSLSITSDKTLVRKVRFTPNAASFTVNAGDLILGDLDQNNKIDSADQMDLYDSISSQTTKGDLNADQETNSIDWSILLTNFGKKGD